MSQDTTIGAKQLVKHHSYGVHKRISANAGLKCEANGQLCPSLYPTRQQWADHMRQARPRLDVGWCRTPLGGFRGLFDFGRQPFMCCNATSN